MKEYEVFLEPEARRDLENIYDFIMTNDTQVQATRFLRKLQKSMMSLNFMPMRCRQSIYIQGDNIRDMIVQGYTICYVVKDANVHILTVFRQRV